MKANKILILSATSAEIQPILSWATGLPGLVIETVGVGPYRTAFHTQKLVAEYGPDLVVLVGIAGCYAGSGADVGEVFLVTEERAADLGSFHGPADAESAPTFSPVFSPKFAERLICPYIPAGATLPVAVSNSLSAAGAPYVARDGVQLENMEGVAFFYTCRALGVPFLELRAVSNVVGEPFERWNIPLAAKNLSESLKTLIHEIIA